MSMSHVEEYEMCTQLSCSISSTADCYSLMFNMSLSTQESSEDDYILVARLDNARIMANILKAIHFKEVVIILFYRSVPEYKT